MTLATTVLDHAQAGRFDEIRELFAPDLRAHVTADTLRASWDAEVCATRPDHSGRRRAARPGSRRDAVAHAGSVRARHADGHHRHQRRMDRRHPARSPYRGWRRLDCSRRTRTAPRSPRKTSRSPATAARCPAPSHCRPRHHRAPRWCCCPVPARTTATRRSAPASRSKTSRGAWPAAVSRSCARKRSPTPTARSCRPRSLSTTNTCRMPAPRRARAPAAARGGRVRRRPQPRRHHRTPGRARGTGGRRRPAGRRRAAAALGRGPPDAVPRNRAAGAAERDRHAGHAGPTRRRRPHTGNAGGRVAVRDTGGVLAQCARLPSGRRGRSAHGTHIDCQRRPRLPGDPGRRPGVVARRPGRPRERHDRGVRVRQPPARRGRGSGHAHRIRDAYSTSRRRSST